MRPPFSRKRGAQVPFSNDQKAYLSRLAGEAHAWLTSKSAIDEPLKDFRQRESIEACGRRISEGVNGDFEAIEARFLMLRGKTERAMHSAMKGETNEERQARYKLAQLCKARGLEVPALEGASVKKIWAVYFNIKQQPKRKAAANDATKLTAAMALAVKEERYEDAGKLKRQIEALLKSQADENDEIPY